MTPDPLNNKKYAIHTNTLNIRVLFIGVPTCDLTIINIHIVPDLNLSPPPPP